MATPETPTAAQKMRLHFVNEAVAALNNLVIFDQASVDRCDMPGWYNGAVEQADQLVNGIQDALLDPKGT